MFSGLNDFFPSCSLLLKTLEAFIGYKLQTSPQSQQAANCVTSNSGLSSFSKVALLTKRQSMGLTNLKTYVVKCSDFVPQGTGALRITNKVPLPLWNFYYNHGRNSSEESVCSESRTVDSSMVLSLPGLPPTGH